MPLLLPWMRDHRPRKARAVGALDFDVKFWGGGSVKPGAPDVTIVEDAVFMPCADGVMYDRDETWGVFDRDGRRSSAAALRRGGDAAVVGGSGDLDPSRIAGLPVMEGEILYGGLLNLHYGHFLCSSISRLWALEGRPGARVIFHGPHVYGDVEAASFAQRSFAALGLPREAVLLPKQPCRIERLVIPHSAFEEQFSAHEAHRRTCLRIGETLRADRGGAGPVYLSKSRLRHGIARIENEGLMEAVLAKHGVEILHPQTLDFAEQVALFASKRTVIGTAGSALHTLMLAPQCGRIIALETRDYANSNGPMIDALCGAETLYVSPSTPSRVRYDDPHYTALTELADPAGVAHGLLSLI